MATPDRVMTGEFGTELQGGYVLLPFSVPAGQTAVRVRYCHDQPELPNANQFRHTLDLDVYGPRSSPTGLWGEAEFRGSSGSATREGAGDQRQVTISEDGFDAATGPTTRSMRPGPITAGEWAVQLPVAAVVGASGGDTDGKVAFRVEVDLIADPVFADEPYSPTPYSTAAARSQPGWYAGDLHVHASHSEGSAEMKEAFDYAFGDAGLDFVSLTDHNTDSAHGEIGAVQPDYPGKLIVRGTEVTTFRGHFMNHATGRYLDHRTGPVFEASLSPAGLVTGLTSRRPARGARELFARVKAAGGFSQVNHPTIFPNQVPLFANLCRGCAWDYSDAETGFENVGGVELATGPAGLKVFPQPGPNPFTLTALQYWEERLARGHKLAALGVSDSHDAGRTPGGPGGLGITQAPIGQATTVVFADELSEQGIRRGVEAGHTYVKVLGNDRPDLRFEARALGSSAPAAIMGDTVRASPVDFVARVLGAAPGTGPEPFELIVFKDGLPIQAAIVTSNDFGLPFRSSGPGRYRLQLQRLQTVEALSSPIYVEPPATTAAPGGGSTFAEPSPDTDGSASPRPASDTVSPGSSSDELPFTGLALGALPLGGLALLLLGLKLRRRSR